MSLGRAPVWQWTRPYAAAAARNVRHARSSFVADRGGSGGDTDAHSGSECGSSNSSSPRVYSAQDPQSVVRAVRALRQEKVIAVPTDTIYGLAADATSDAAVSRIFDIKRRDRQKAVAICVSDVCDIAELAQTSHLPPRLLTDLLPGPVTLLLRKRADAALSPLLSPESDCIGIRIPDYTFLRRVAAELERPLALTSANLSGQRSPLATADFASLWPLLAAVIDGGVVSPSRAGSTVIDLTRPGTYLIVRDGSALEQTTETLQQAAHSLKRRFA